jgi:phosphoenolpyruvate carboxylase
LKTSIKTILNSTKISKVRSAHPTKILVRCALRTLQKLINQ